ncbi:MAG: Fic family protein [Proteobacteria bacterium]|nr:Fic family protein [Pseudomonadota bacterium]MBU1708755.1 Fic family protein [Pseudomonadota bacterium]
MKSDRIRKVLNRIDEGKRLIDQHRPLPASVLARLKQQLVLDWTYNSNAIEGNTLTLRETKLVLEDGLTVGGKSMREHLEAINHREAIAYVEELAREDELLLERHLKEIHALVLREIDQQYAGRYRDIQVRISGSNHLPPEPFLVGERMQAFARKWLTNTQITHPVVQAALAHYELVAIHPFVDGNGRTARLIMNLMLMRKGYAPAIILKNDRKKYYDALEKAHKGKTEDFIFLVARAVERTISLYFEAIPKLASGFLTMAQAAEITSYSQGYLNVLARRGAIPAFKLRRNWLVAEDALQRYIEDHQKE